MNLTAVVQRRLTLVKILSPRSFPPIFSQLHNVSITPWGKCNCCVSRTFLLDVAFEEAVRFAAR